MAGSRLTRVLIDGGSGLNLLFTSTIAKMGLDISDKLTPSKAPFYSIVPGNTSTPIGTVVLPVTFGRPDNYRTELIKFEVASFQILISCHTRTTGLGQVHGCSSLHLPTNQDARTDGSLTFHGDLQKSF